MTRRIFGILAVLLSLFILVEVNLSLLSPQSRLAIFAMLGLILVFLKYPIYRRAGSANGKLGRTAGRHREDHRQALIQNPRHRSHHCCRRLLRLCSDSDGADIPKVLDWRDASLGDRAGIEETMDYVIGLLGVLLVLEATRRSIGWTLPLLAAAFLGYAAFGQSMPDWLFPHRGYSWERIVSQTFLHSQGVFGIALKVMFAYVFLFVLFGTVLEKTGATGYIISFARRLFRASAGGPAKVAVISSGMMGSLSG